MNKRIKELAEQAGFVFDEHNEPTQRKLEAFVDLLSTEYVAICDDLAAKYVKHRRDTDDFGDKNIFAEGETAAKDIAKKIKKYANR